MPLFPSPPEHGNMGGSFCPLPFRIYATAQTASHRGNAESGEGHGKLRVLPIKIPWHVYTAWKEGCQIFFGLALAPLGAAYVLVAMGAFWYHFQRLFRALFAGAPPGNGDREPDV